MSFGGQQGQYSLFGSQPAPMDTTIYAELGKSLGKMLISFAETMEKEARLEPLDYEFRADRVPDHLLPTVLLLADVELRASMYGAKYAMIAHYRSSVLERTQIKMMVVPIVRVAEVLASRDNEEEPAASAEAGAAASSSSESLFDA